MSLLEDIFLGDEANEAQELERVIEGDEYDERPRSPENSDNDSVKGDDEAEEEKRRVDPTSTKTKRVTKNPRFILNPARLTGPRGIQVIPEHFKDFKFKGKGHEKEDLDLVLKKLEHWAYRLYPKFQFQDCLKKIEMLGKKRPVMVHLHKIRTDQYISEETVIQKDSSDEETQPPQEEDEFDKLLQQQIELARATPAPGSVKKVVDRSDQWERVMETPKHDRSLIMPKATSSPSISDEQKERMIRNRKLAEERRLARLKQATMDNPIKTLENIEENNKSIDNSQVIQINDEDLTKKKANDDIIEVIDGRNITVPKKVNRSNVIDSSDSEDDIVTAVNESIVVDVHNGNHEENSRINNVDTEKNNEVEDMAIDNDNIEKNVDENDKIHQEHNLIGNIEITKTVDQNHITGEIIDTGHKDTNKNDRTEENIEIDNNGVVIQENNSKIMDEDSNKNKEIQINNEEQSHLQVENDNTVMESSENAVDTEVNKEVGSSKSNKGDQEKSAVELTEDIMDVDFSDDF